VAGDVVRAIRWRAQQVEAALTIRIAGWAYS
jgi:hypothetical protein